MNIFPPVPGQSEALLATIGFSSAATTEEILDLVAESLAAGGLDAGRLVALASHTRKHDSAVLAAVADRLGLPLRLLGDAELEPGYSSLCEAVAAAAGPLRVGKRKSRYATCAISACAPDWSPAQFGQPAPVTAATAASMLATSWAGP